MTNNAINTRNPIVQTVSTSTSAVVTCATQFRTNVIPQQGTDGDQVLSLVITPLSATSILIIKFVFMASNSAGSSQISTGIFQDAIANALAATTCKTDTSNMANACITYSMVAGTTIATTFKLMVGSINGAGTVYVNGDSAGTRRFGGVASTFLTITEYLA